MSGAGDENQLVSEAGSKPPTSFLTSRRAFLTAVGGGLFAIASTVDVKSVGQKAFGKLLDAGGDLVGTVSSSVVSNMLGHVEPLSAQNAELAKAVFFGTCDWTTVFPSTDNPFSKIKGITGPTKFAAEHLVGTHLVHRKNVRTDHHILVDRLDGNILCLGGPVTNKLTELFMGRSGRSMLTDSLAGAAPLSLPCWVDIDYSHAQHARGESRRHNAGNLRTPKYETAPVWTVRSPEGVYVPRVEEGVLLNDYLHIVSLPNMASQTAFQMGRRAVFCFGSHGAGMKAVALFLRSERLMAQILERTAKMAAWHCIVPVNVLSSDGSEPVSLAPKAIIHPIYGEFEAIASAIAKEKDLTKHLPQVRSRPNGRR